MSIIITQEQFENDVKANNPYSKIIGEYKGIDHKIECQCLLCSKNYLANPYDVRKGKKHMECAVKMQTYKRTKSTEQFKNELYNISPEIIVFGEYVNAKENIKCQCSIHKEFFFKPPTNLLRGQTGCPICKGEKISRSLMKSENNFLKQLSEINPNVEVVGKYNGAKNHIIVRCKICGFEWSPVAGSLISGFGCPHCSESHGEKRIRLCLEKYNIKYQYEKKFDNLFGVGHRKLSYDFYLYEYNYLIEYQGEYHDHTAKNQTEEQFIVQKEHDYRKRQYAKDNNINLLEIWYWDFDNIENIIEREIVLNKEPVTTTVT